jgi:cobalamin synthase
MLVALLLLLWTYPLRRSSRRERGWKDTQASNTEDTSCSAHDVTLQTQHAALQTYIFHTLCRRNLGGLTARCVGICAEVRRSLPDDDWSVSNLEEMIHVS